VTKENFISERTSIISEMLDNPDRYGIYPTTKCFAMFDDLFDKITKTNKLSWSQKYEFGLIDK